MTGTSGIHAECYAPNATNYAHISFNFGPTLLSWLETHHLPTYQKILNADKASAEARGGHGNAIAQVYGHAILPLCNERDRLTQVVWGWRISVFVLAVKRRRSGCRRLLRTMKCWRC